MKNYDSTTKKAADICGASQGASEAAQRAEPVGREERSQYNQQVRPFVTAVEITYRMTQIFFINFMA